MAGVDAYGVGVVSLFTQRLLQFDQAVKDSGIYTQVYLAAGVEYRAVVSHVPADDLPQPVPPCNAPVEILSLHHIEGLGSV